MSACPLPPPGWACTRAAGHDGPCAALPTRDPNDYELALAALDVVRERLKAMYGNGIAPADTSTALNISPIARESYRFLLLQDKLGLIDVITHLAIVAGRRHH